MRVSFTGHRPNKLGTGYSITNERVQAYRDMLRNTLHGLIQHEGVRTFITGGAIGIDQIAFWTCEGLANEYGREHFQNILAVPFAKQHTAWKNDELVGWYHKMKERADYVEYVDELGLQDRRYYSGSSPYGLGEYSALKMQLRNQYMVDHSDIVVAVWDGSSGGTANCVKYAESVGKRIIRLNPLQF